MERNRKRPDASGDLPADKRPCSLSEFRTPISEQNQITNKTATSSASTTMDPVHDSSDHSDQSGSESDSPPPSPPSTSTSTNPTSRNFQRLLEPLQNPGSAEVAPALFELCEALSFCNEDSVRYVPVEMTVPPLVRIAAWEGRPDEMLLAVRAITYLCDVMPRSAESVVRHGALPVLCGRLTAIEYLDVAEQCLQALEKISKRQPVACVQAGAISAVLAFIDFFSTSIQRTAVSAVANMCKRVLPDCSPFIMESLSQLCNLLQNGDPKLVETVATCLIRIVDSYSSSPELLDELCQAGILVKIADFIGGDGKTLLSKAIYLCMIGLLTKLASGSLVAVKSLLELNIGNVLKSIFVDSDVSHSIQYSQTNEVLRLVNQIIPSAAKDMIDMNLTLAKEKILTDQPGLLCQFSKDILPVFIKAVNSGANLYVSYGCISVASNIFYFSTPDMLLDLLQDINISSLLASLLSKRDHHVLFSALKAVEILMQKLPDFFLTSFIKEGVVYQIDSLLMEEKSQNSETKSRCLCFIFNPPKINNNSEPKSCNLGNEKGAIFSFAKNLKGKYFTQEVVSCEMGLTEISHKLKTCCQLLNESIDNVYPNEEYLLGEIMKELNGGETMTTFEFVESGIIKSLANYLTNGKYLKDKTEINSNHYNLVLKRFKSFARVCLKTTDNNNNKGSNEILLISLIRKLQSALSSFDTFPVILSHGFRHRPVRTEIPLRHYTSNPYIRVSFVKEDDELDLINFEGGALNVQSNSSLAEIESFLWTKVVKKDCNEEKKGSDEGSTAGRMETSSTCSSEDAVVQERRLSTSSDDYMSDNSDADQTKEPTSSEDNNSQPKLIFKLKGKNLSRSIPLYQSLLDDQTNSEPDVINGPKFWTDVHKITYSKASETQTESQSENPLQSSPFEETTGGVQWHKIPFFSSLLQADFPCNLPKSSPSFDILFMLRTLEGLNSFSYELLFEDKIDSFAEGKLTQLEGFKPVFSPSPVPNEEFVSTKLTEKLEQQMRDPLALNPSGLPLWCKHLMQTSPFLFSFDTREKYFKLMNFGNLIMNNQEGNNDDLSPPSRRSKEKFKVDRNNIFDSACKMMESKAKNKALLEIEYLEEVGTGLGPTIEFYTLIGHEFQKNGLQMWRGDFCGGKNVNVCELGFVESKFGLFPRPKAEKLIGDVSKRFELLGQIIAKAIRDGRIVDIPFSTAFYKAILDQELNVYDILSFDPDLGRALLEFEALVKRREYLMKLNNTKENQELISNLYYKNVRIEDSGIDFSVPGYDDYFLPNEQNPKLVNSDNLKEYIEMVTDATVKTGVQTQIEAFRSGFNQVFPLSALKVFTGEELDSLICGEKVNWTFTELVDNIKFDHGYTPNSPPVINLLEIMQEFESENRKAFLQFVTGSPRLPPGGLASLNPKLTVVRKLSNSDTDMELPSVMTCANYLKLPGYSTKDKMKERLLYAITEGQGSFHLS
ncbi:hypothetical protein LUZ60_011097 [Juncus effusus]|nr:hypothetical protein LUZ60_011097 [Juncus effusus]